MNQLERRGRPPISPAQHAVLDYTVAATFCAAGFALRRRNRAAARLAFANAGMIIAMSMLTDYPGGLFRSLSFRGHRRGDIVQALATGAGPLLLGFASRPEATYFYVQALAEAGVIAATDWNAPAAA